MKTNHVINQMIGSKTRRCSPSFYQLILELNFVFHAQYLADGRSTLLAS